MDLLRGRKTKYSAKKLKTRVTVLEMKTDNNSNESLFTCKKPKRSNSDNPVLDRRRMTPDRADQAVDS